MFLLGLGCAALSRLGSGWITIAPSNVGKSVGCFRPPPP